MTRLLHRDFWPQTACLFCQWPGAAGSGQLLHSGRAVLGGGGGGGGAGGSLLHEEGDQLVLVRRRDGRRRHFRVVGVRFY